MDTIKQLAKKIFQWEARLVLRRYKPKIIAITGSVGKSSTKEAIYLVLSRKFFVRKSEKSFTAELGVALTVLGCPSGSGTTLDWLRNLILGLQLILWRKPYPEYLILEVDGDKPGDLMLVSSLITPDILVMTAIGEVPSHIELFSDLESFLFEKRVLINSVRREGVIFYNMDDKVTSNLLLDTEIKKVSCGIGKGGDFFGTDFEILLNEKQLPTGMSFEVGAGGETHKVNIFGSLGIQNEYASLLAFALGNYFEIPKQQIVTSLNKFTALPGRMNLIEGIKETLILDDSYNSSPIALSQAIAVFKSIKVKGRRITVIGDMLELGKYSGESHRKVAKELKTKVNLVVCIGIRTRKICEELLNLGFKEQNILTFENGEEAANGLQNLLKKGDLILVKGSQDMRLERFVEEVMANPKEARKLLVRQEEVWRGR